MVKLIDGKDHMPEAKALIKEYLERLGRDLSFQSVEAELKDLSAKYSPPEGELLMAEDNGEILGMVAYHKLSGKVCEMKRLYVRPENRGRHLGELLVEGITAHAAAAGFERMVLDTIRPLEAAVGLYRKLGFTQCEPYYHNPMDDVIYMSKDL